MKIHGAASVLGQQFEWSKLASKADDGNSTAEACLASISYNVPQISPTKLPPSHQCPLQLRCLPCRPFSNSKNSPMSGSLSSPSPPFIPSLSRSPIDRDQDLQLHSPRLRPSSGSVSFTMLSSLSTAHGPSAVLFPSSTGASQTRAFLRSSGYAARTVRFSMTVSTH